MADILIPETFGELIRGFTGIIVALGGVVLIYLIFNIINFYNNRKRMKELNKMHRKIDIILALLDKKGKFKR